MAWTVLLFYYFYCFYCFYCFIFIVSIVFILIVLLLFTIINYSLSLSLRQNAFSVSTFQLMVLVQASLLYSTAYSTVYSLQDRMLA